MGSIKLDPSKFSKVSNLKLVLVILGIPFAVLLVGVLTKVAPDAYYWVFKNTNGLISPTLTLYLIMYFIIVHLMLIKGSKITLVQLGVEKSKLKAGIIVTLGLFLILQFYGVLYSYLTLGKLVVNEAMVEWVAVIGYYLELIFGVAVFEEIIFRGFLIPQVFIRLKARENNASRMFLTLGISQFLFAIVHVPIRLANGMSLIDAILNLGTIFIIGIIIAFVYLLTENIFIAMGVHSIWNASLNNSISIFSSKYAFVVVIFFVFIMMYLKATGNRNNNTMISNDL